MENKNRYLIHAASLFKDFSNPLTFDIVLERQSATKKRSIDAVNIFPTALKQFPQWLDQMKDIIPQLLITSPLNEYVAS